MKLTLTEAKRRAADHGCVLSRDLDGEIKVNFRGGSEPTAYYTDDLLDAVQTAGAMAAGRKLGSI